MNMNKNLFWMLTAFTMCGMVMTACSDDDKTSGQKTDETTEIVDFPEKPTTDLLETQIKRPAYVFDAQYTGEGKAVVARATKKSDLTDENLEVVIMPSAQIEKLTGDDYLNIIRVVGKGGTIVFVEPELSELDDFCKQVAAAINIYSPAAEVANEYMSADAIQRILLWSDITPFAALAESNEKDHYEIIALRNQTVYASINDHEGVVTKQTVGVEAEKKEEEGAFETIPIEFEFPNEMNDNYFGYKADDLAEWINSNEPEEPEEEAAEARAMIANRAGETASLQSLTKAQTIILNGSNNNLYFQWGKASVRAIYHPITLRYDIWAAYSTDKKCDFYCIKLSVTAENDKLGCGPTEPRKWYDGVYCDFWKKLNNSLFAVTSRNIYGPFMTELDMDFNLENGKAQLADYTPKNSTSGGATVAESFSFSLGGNVGANASGPTGGISANCTWGSSVSKFNPDLKATATADMSSGKLAFNYKAGRPIAEWNMFKDPQHSGTKDIAIKTCTVEHAWVWQVESNADAVTLNTRFKSVDEWLTYESFGMKCTEYYLPIPCEHKFKSLVNCPPRFKQEWAMTIEPANSKAEAYLASKLPKYFMNSSTLFTRKENHTKENATDEISAWVTKSKAVFDKNSTILKGAAQEGGITGNYIIRWHQVNGTGGTDNDFTYEAKIK